MGQELTNLASESARLAARVNSLYASIERDHHLRDTLPSPIDKQTRQALEEHRRTLHGRLRGIGEAMADRQAAGKAIGEFLLGYLNARSVNVQQTLASYISTMSDQPLFAILESIEDFRNGRVFDIDSKDGSRIPFTLDHAPSAPRLLDQVKKRAGYVQEERHKVIRLLAVKNIRERDVPAEERERVGALMRELADGMAMKATADREDDLKKLRAQIAEGRARTERIKQDAAERRRKEQAAHAG